MKTFKQFLRENDADYYDQIVNFIKRDCSEFLEENKNNPLWRGVTPQSISRFDFPIGDDGETFKIRGSVRSDRTPRDSDQWLHEVFDDFFLKKFGIRFRSNALFCVKDEDDVDSEYGKPFAIFPIGKFDYAYSDYIDDPTATFSTSIPSLPKMPAPGVLYMKIMKTLIDEKFFDEKSTEELSQIKTYDMMTSYLSSSIIDITNVFRVIKSDKFNYRFYELFLEYTEDFMYTNDNLRRVKNGYEIMVNCKQYYAIPANVFKHLKF